MITQKPEEDYEHHFTLGRKRQAAVAVVQRHPLQTVYQNIQKGGRRTGIHGPEGVPADTQGGQGGKCHHCNIQIPGVPDTQSAWG